MLQKDQYVDSKDAEIALGNEKQAEMQQYLERKEEEVVKLWGILKEMKEQND